LEEHLGTVSMKRIGWEFPLPTRHGTWAYGKLIVWLGFWPLGLVKAITTITVLQICRACTIDCQIWRLYILCWGLSRDLTIWTLFTLFKGTWFMNGVH
jgi:hypothetical protein